MSWHHQDDRRRLVELLVDCVRCGELDEEFELEWQTPADAGSDQWIADIQTRTTRVTVTAACINCLAGLGFLQCRWQDDRAICKLTGRAYAALDNAALASDLNPSLGLESGPEARL